MSAVISPCGMYRYRLERECTMPFEGSKVIAYFGINPSTADAVEDDPTVKKWRGFTLLNGGHRFIVGNVFAYRATDVNELSRVCDPLGADNLETLQGIIADADILVPCWGKLSKVPIRLHQHFPVMWDLFRASGKPVLNLGLNVDGSPKHPARLAYSTPLVAHQW